MSAKPLCALLLAVPLAGACGASSATTVPVKGKDPDVALLAGKWLGDYEGTDSGRRGSISFDLALGYHTAEGQVIMQPGGESAGVPLQIKFVSIGSGEISGKIAPYTDPSCSCTVETEFAGHVAGSSMDGTFTTRLPDGAEQKGRWSAQRTTP